MELNYKEELFELLKNNSITTLPSYQAISNDEKLAVLAWKSFNYDYNPNYQEFNFKKWYAEGDWNNTLQAYSNNTAFWEKILESRFNSNKYGYNDENNSYTLLLDEDFKKSYPVIVNHFLKNNDKLLELFNKTKNKTFFDLITLSSEEKVVAMKEFITNIVYKHDYLYSPYDEELKKNQNDREFISKLLAIDFNIYSKLDESLRNDKEYIDIILKSPASFKLLSQELKENTDYIEIALKNRDNFYELSSKNQGKYFDQWIEKGITTITYKSLQQFNNVQREKIFSLNTNLFKQFLDHKADQAYPIAEKLLRQDFNKFIDIVPVKVLLKLDYSDLESIKPTLENFIDNYNKQGLEKSDEKYLILISKHTELFEKLNENLFYKLNSSIEEVTKNTVGKPWFINMSAKILTQLDEENLTPQIAENYLKKARNKLTIDTLKDLKLPNEDIIENVRNLLAGQEIVKKVKPKN